MRHTRVDQRTLREDDVAESVRLILNGASAWHPDRHGQGTPYGRVGRPSTGATVTRHRGTRRPAP